MATRHKDVLIISSRLSKRRERALRGTFEADAHIEILHSGEPIGDVQQYDAVVLDGSQASMDAESVDHLRTFVMAGGSLVAIGSAPRHNDGALALLFGAISESPQPHAEVFGKAAMPGHDLLRRLDSEFSLNDSFSPLRSLNGDTRVLLNVNWGLRDHPAALERILGAGRIVITSLGNSDEALQAVSFSTFLRRSLHFRNGTSEERVLGVGLVGYGRQGGMGLVHGMAVRNTEGLELTAVCDPAQERLEAAETNFPGVQTYSSLEELAADDDVDVVIVATPPATHASISLAFLQRGKHVAVEKPMCLTVEEANDLIAASRTNRVMLTINQNRRWDSDFIAIRRAVDAGQLGELFNVETFVGSFEHPCRYWHSDASVSGGTIYDWGSHYIDWILQLMAGMPVTVSANAHKRVWHDVTNFDQVRVRMLWEDGREAEFLHSEIAAIRRPKFYLQGTAGTLAGHYRPIAIERIDAAEGYIRDEPHYAEAPADLLLSRYESGYGITETRLPPAPRPSLPFYRNLANHLHLGEPLAVTPESVRRVIAVLEAAEYSAHKGAVTVALSEP
jgi:predicted dehydrogenase